MIILNTKKLILWIFCLLATQGFSQITFQETIGGLNNETGTWIIETTNGYLVAGHTTDNGGNQDALLIRFDLSGNIIWQRRYGGPQSDIFYAVVEDNGGFLAVGETRSFGAGNADIFMVKLDPLGAIIWSKTIGKFGFDESARSIVAVPGGRFLVSGLSVSGGGNTTSIFSLVDATGLTIWSQLYTSGIGNILYSNYINGNTIYASGGIDSEAAFLRLDLATGDILNTSVYAGSSSEALYYQQPTQDGNLVIADHTHSAPTGVDIEVWVQKVNPATGQVLWSKVYYRANDNLRGRIEKVNDGGFLLSPYDNFNTPLADALLAKIDANGTLLWSYNYGGSASDRLFKAVQTADGGFIAVGDSRSSSANGNSDILLVKTDANGLIDGSCPEPGLIQSANFTASSVTRPIAETAWVQTAALNAAPLPLNLVGQSFNPNIIPTISQTVPLCPNKSFTIGGVAYFAPQIVNYSTGAQGCDTIHNYDLTLLTNSAFALNLSACATDAVVYNGTSIPAGTSQDFILINSAGCDSIVTVSVTALPTSSSSLNMSACPGGSANYNGTSIPVGTSQNFTLANAAGCDSIVTVSVTALSTSSNSLNMSACPGGSANYNGTSIPVGRSQNFTLTNAAGCDSIVTVSVTALPTSSSSLNMSACPGGAANYNGASIPVGTSQNFTLTNAAGCDSIVTVSVTALSTSSNSLNMSACPGGSANYNGTNIPVGSSQNFTLTNAAGCDSIVTVSVTALPTSSSSLNMSACPGGSANYNGTNIPVGKSQNFTLTNAAGCDSIVTVSVTALPTSGSSLNMSACPGGSANYNGTSIPVGTSQNFTLTNASGCDSIVTVSVTALATSSSSLNMSACPGSSAIYQGTSIPVGTSQNFTLTNTAGCDSIVTVSVTALAMSSSSLNMSACPGGSANYNGASIPVGTSQNFTLTNAAGCDSIVTVSVTALPTSSSSLTMSVCPGGSAIYNGTNIPVGTSQNFTLTNAAGCDSIVTVSVTALPTSSSSLNMSACPGGSANYQGMSIPVGTSQNFTLTNAAGCDSIVTVSVTALPTSSSSLNMSACPGGSAIYNGAKIPVGISQNFTLTNAAGCDSIVTVTVVALPMSNSGFSVGICHGGTYSYQGMTLQAGDIQDFILTNFAGCDSLVTVSVFEKNISSNVIQVEVCPDATYDYGGEEIAAGDSQEFHFTNAENCDSTVTVFVSAFPETVFGLQAEPSCSNAPTGILEVSGVSGGLAPFHFSLNNIDFQDSTRFTGISAGSYTVYVEDSNGCVFERDTDLAAIPELKIQLANGILPCDNAGVVLQPTVLSGDSSALLFNWWNGGREATNFATEAGQIWVEVTDECSTVRSEASIHWAELSKDLDIVYVPNVFMPSSKDAANTEFKPLFAAGITVLGFHFKVFDRWGDQLFETSSTSDGWGGLFRDHEFNPGVQVWQLEADIAICGRVLHVERKGDVTVVR